VARYGAGYVAELGRANGHLGGRPTWQESLLKDRQQSIRARVRTRRQNRTMEDVVAAPNSVSDHLTLALKEAK
jgi:hypothetical protein